MHLVCLDGLGEPPGEVLPPVALDGIRGNAVLPRYAAKGAVPRGEGFVDRGPIGVRADGADPRHLPRLRWQVVGVCCCLRDLAGAGVRSLGLGVPAVSVGLPAGGGPRRDARPTPVAVPPRPPAPPARRSAHRPPAGGTSAGTTRRSRTQRTAGLSVLAGAGYFRSLKLR